MSNSPVSDKLEKMLINFGYDSVVGIDEVGRGSWAGPVVACAYVYDISTKIIPDVNDSKKLTRSKRKNSNEVK